MDKFLRRTCVTVILLLIVYGVVYKLPLLLFAAVISLFISMAQMEFFKMVERRELFVYKYFGIIAGSLYPLIIYAGHRYYEVGRISPFLMIVAALLIITLQLMRRENARDHLLSMSVTIFSLFYICWFFSFLVKLRLMDNGANLVAFIIIVTKGADIGAYVGGSRFGKHELLPRISPNKTWEGIASGLVFSVIFSVAFGRLVAPYGIYIFGVLGVSIGLIGQIGDLAESLIKRDCNVKDSGNHLSDIGGFFDLIDSLLFTVPVFYYIVLLYF